MVGRTGGVLFSFFFFFCYLCFSNFCGVYCLVLEWELTGRMGMDVCFPMVLDFTSCMFVSVVLYISGCVTLFSGFYMAHDKFFCRFLYVLMLFVFSMVLLVLFPGYLSLMVGWDGLGVTSFLLVVYYTDWDSLSAGMITALSNRVGDMFFVVGVAFMSFSLSFSMFDVAFIKNFFSSNVLYMLGILLILGSMTKSAVMPFSAWLPEAMAAPTPVSSLVHSSTLVTAGVYVLIRFGDLAVEFCSCFLMMFSLVTVVMAGMSALSLVDVKKVIALSTLSQVSMMMLSISVGAVSIGFFHLLVHAFFKALMFLCVGSVIFYSGGVQDARFLGSLWISMPLVFSLFIISNLCLVGFPFLSGYYSKELIVSSFLSGYSSLIGFGLVYLSLVFTFGYSFRMIWLLCSYQMSFCMVSFKSDNFYLNSSLLLMSVGAVGSGVLFQSFMMKMNFYSFMSVYMFYGGLLLVGFWVVNLLFLFWLMEESFYKQGFHDFVGQLWFMKFLSGGVISSLFLHFFSLMMNFIDMGWIRGFIWKGGLKSFFNKGTNSVRAVNFRPLGLLLCFGILLWILVFFW
uniref:NADH-ubiquinone oxidoreductase chain 5 n=1 Tax=Meretrix lusoria TaxID=74491 RepID=E5D140_MERLU|nr:NADH dehydrogenase subunit 5 [Meretrix lusoria]ACV92129.1 NADH dehydrogenase subunit 5 [Meretrix lusoria]